MVLLLLYVTGVEYARWRVILVCFALLASAAAEPVKNLTQYEYFEYEHKKLPTPDTLKDIAPSVQVFSYDKGSSNEIKNDVARSVEVIKQHITVNTSRIVFITHGFRGSISESWMAGVKNAILSISRGNQQIVVLVGWKKGARFLRLNPYKHAAANTQPVGRFIGNIAAEVKKQQSTLQIYGIGHSLGSHVMGKAGRQSQSLGSPFSRITGLDPAGPLFEGVNLDKRLSATDAELVDVIHTDGNPSGYSIVPDYYGTLIPLGHLDFYPNWGTRPQPGCPNDVANGKGKKGCSHNKAIDYYKWSITNKCEFLCESKIRNTPTRGKIDRTVDTISKNDEMPEMGYYADTRSNKSGYYYIATNANPPYVSNTYRSFDADSPCASNTLKVQWSPLVMLFLLTINLF